MSSTRPSALRGLMLLAAAFTVAGTGSAHAGAPEDSAPTPVKKGAALKASLKYVDGSKGEVPAWSGILVTIIRDGQQVETDLPLPPAASTSYFAPPKLIAVDLDDDAEPEVLIDVFTQAFDRRRSTVVLRHTGGRYVASVNDWGPAGYRLADVTGGKSPEFLTSDSRVPHLFGGTDRGPLRVLAYGAGQVRDVSRDARPELIRDAKRHRRALARVRRAGADTRPEVAAYVADLVRIGRVGEARATIRTAGRRHELHGSTKAFARRLDRGLVRFGYAKRKTLAGGV